MEDLRASLIAKVDTLIAQIYENPEESSGVHLQFEACLFHERQIDSPETPPRRFIVDTIKLDDWRNAHRSNNAEHIQPVSSLPSLVHGNSDSGVDASIDQQNGIVDTETPLNRRGTRALARRKMVGGLRLGNNACDSTMNTPPRTPTPPSARQLESDDRHFPKRRKLDRDGPAKLEQSTVNKLIEGVWEQIHRPKSLALGKDFEDALQTVADRVIHGSHPKPARSIGFEDASRCCQQITSGSRTGRALEVIVQAHWVDCYEARIQALHQDRPYLKTCEAKKIVMTEACTLFSWSEKELRNRMAIWRGYRDIKNAAGWVVLVFSGPGIYRFCKYRLGFDQEALGKLQSIALRAEVAADTLHPQWRQLLSLVGAPTQIHWRGHPHDWVVSKRKDPVPLSSTYRQWDPNFSFQQINESVVDETKWNDIDPRRSDNGPDYICGSCSRPQSTLAEKNECECFPDLFGPNPRTPAAVQIFRTENGRNNGLIACCSFERGIAVGEFVGLITKGLTGIDVMQSQAGEHEPYQIWQGRSGNFTRFINHSCQPNCHFQTFSWLGIQRIIVVSKGVPAGKELTVDYSGRYWQHLDKVCLCGEARCRYKNRT